MLFPGWQGIATVVALVVFIVLLIVFFAKITK